MPEPDRYRGKYQGTVVSTTDPESRGRIQAQVPGVYADTTSTWALPCFPFAGQGMGFYALPAIGAGVFIEFLDGDLNHPVWSGCSYLSESEVPSDALSGTPELPNTVLQTIGGHTIILSDAPGGEGITLRTQQGASLVINDDGITISNGQGASISLSGSTVSINNGALTVT